MIYGWMIHRSHGWDCSALIRLAVGVALLIFVLPAPRAKAFVDLNIYYYSDGFKTTATTSSTRMLIEGTAGFNIDKKGSYQAGWYYGMITADDKTTTTDKFSSAQMGPRFNFYFDKARQWCFGVAYNISTTGTYTPAGGTAEKLKGTGLKADIGYRINMSETFRAGVKLNYWSSSFNEKLTNGTDYEKVTYNRTFMYPSVSLGADF